jgi:hypothetical protein
VENCGVSGMLRTTCWRVRVAQELCCGVKRDASQPAGLPNLGTLRQDTEDESGG